jgi:hypothetical protein
MGIGKTRQAIVAMQIAAPEGAILVVCPASLKLNWRREIRLVDCEAPIEVIGSWVSLPLSMAVARVAIKFPSDRRCGS